MPTAHVNTESERTAAAICGWARDQRVEHNIATKPQEYGRAMTDHVVLTNMTDEQLTNLMHYLETNGWSDTLAVQPEPEDI